MIYNLNLFFDNGHSACEIIMLINLFSSCSILKDVSLDEVKIPPNVPMTVPSIETKEIKISLLIKIILSLYYILGGLRVAQDIPVNLSILYNFSSFSSDSTKKFSF